MPYLVFFRRGLPLVHGALDRAVTLIGRRRPSHLILDERGLADVHAEIRGVGGRYTFLDRSGRGATVDGKTVEGAELRDGTELSFGELAAVFREEIDPPDERERETEELRLSGHDLPAELFVRAYRKDEPAPFCERPLRTMVEIGDGPDAGLRLPASTVSKVHARVSLREGEILLQDRGSTNGTWYEDARIHEMILPPGRSFEVGPFRLCVGGPKDAVRPRELTFEGMLSASPIMHRLFRELEKVAPSQAPVVILGESGCGKELFAKALHRRSPRANGRFFALNCANANVEPTQVESRLFGHLKGAFTGAVASAEGAFGTADGGTLFLDELAELQHDLQAKLLRAIELGEILPLGARLPKHVDVRFVAATHKSLHAETAAGRFRSDLFYRLAIVTLQIPPLRERPEDVVPLWHRFARELAVGEIPQLGSDAAAKLRGHAWPGNVRELHGLVWRTLLHREGNRVDASAIRFDAAEAPAAVARSHDGRIETAGRTMDEIEKDAILTVLRQQGGDSKAAATQLGISRQTLQRRLKSWGVDAGDDSDGK